MLSFSTNKWFIMKVEVDIHINISCFGLLFSFSSIYILGFYNVSRFRLICPSFKFFERCYHVLFHVFLWLIMNVFRKYSDCPMLLTRWFFFMTRRLTNHFVLLLTVYTTTWPCETFSSWASCHWWSSGHSITNCKVHAWAISCVPLIYCQWVWFFFLPLIFCIFL